MPFALFFFLFFFSGLGLGEAGLLFAVSMLGVVLNYWADFQRQVFRERDGKVCEAHNLWACLFARFVREDVM